MPTKPERNHGPMTREQQAQAFYDWYWDQKKGFRSVPENFYKTELLYFANLYLEIVAWGHKWSEEELVTEFRKITAEKSAETRRQNTKKKKEQKKRDDLKSRQGDLFDDSENPQN